MNTLGIDDNLDRARIKKLLAIGLVASVVTGVGDFLLGYALPADVGGGMWDNVLATAPNLSERALFAGALLGAVGIALEALSYVAVYRLMADAAPRYAHIFRASIIGYLWLAPIGCHMNVGVMNYAYKYVWLASPALAHQMVGPLFLVFGEPVYVLLVCFWVPGIVVQFRAFSRGLTPYPRAARWFNLGLGAVPCLLVAALLGPQTALGSAVGTMFLSWGNAAIFGGLLATLPSEERFAAFRQQLGLAA